MSLKRLFLVGLVGLILFGCTSNYKVIDNKGENLDVSGDLSTDNSLYALIKPYKDSLGETMQKVIGVSDDNLEIGNPEGKLGNFIADLVLVHSRSLASEEIDFSILNNGGLRVPIDKGDITIGNIYELMPFENELVVLTLKGSAVMDIVEYIAVRSGEDKSAKLGVPISGVRVRLKSTATGNEVSEVRVGMLTLDTNKFYNVVTSDYLAGGGDNMKFFSKATDKKNLNVKLRDVIIAYIEQLHNKGYSIKGALDGRVSIDK